MQNSLSLGKGSSATKARVSWPNSPFADKPTIGELVDRRLDPSKIGEKSKTHTRLSCLYFHFFCKKMCCVAHSVCLLSVPRCIAMKFETVIVKLYLKVYLLQRGLLSSFTC